MLTVIGNELRMRQENEANPLTAVQVTIWKEDEASPPCSERSHRFVFYRVYGSDLGGVLERSEEEDIDDLLAVLGLPR